MKLDPQTEAAVLEMLNRFIRALEERDLNTALGLFAPDPDAVYIGTGQDEKRVGPDELRAQLERDLAQSESTSLELRWHSISGAGPVAWFAADGTARARVEGRDISFPLRLTGVLERRGDKWLFVQSHGSLPAASEREGQSFPEATA